MTRTLAVVRRNALLARHTSDKVSAEARDEGGRRADAAEVEALASDEESLDAALAAAVGSIGAGEGCAGATEVARVGDGVGGIRRGLRSRRCSRTEVEGYMLMKRRASAAGRRVLPKNMAGRALVPSPKHQQMTSSLGLWVEAGVPYSTAHTTELCTASATMQHKCYQSLRQSRLWHFIESY